MLAVMLFCFKQAVCSSMAGNRGVDVVMSQRMPYALRCGSIRLISVLSMWVSSTMVQAAFAWRVLRNTGRSLHQVVFQLFDLGRWQILYRYTMARRDRNVSLIEFFWTLAGPLA